MADANKTIAGILEAIPRAEEVRRQIAENAKQAKLLKKVLRMAEAREDVESVALSNDNGANTKGTRSAIPVHRCPQHFASVT